MNGRLFGLASYLMLDEDEGVPSIHLMGGSASLS
jgi:hypothetical protein